MMSRNAMKYKIAVTLFAAALLSPNALTSVCAQPIYTALHSFTPLSLINPGSNSDGAVPVDGLILSGSTLYGTARLGGSSSAGAVFAVNTDGTGFTNLYSFTALSGPDLINSDGAWPYGSLILSGNTLYGTAYGGGSSGDGTVFAINSDGTGFTNLYTFKPGTNGWGPYCSLILSGNTLYGTTAGGAGTVFAINTNGMGFTNLYRFTGGSDGGTPFAGLILSGNTLYGTTDYGGSSNCGTVFAINPMGSGFTNLYSFTNGSDGAFPYGSLILSGNTLYGTAAGYPPFDSYLPITGYGTVFAINTDGTDFTNLHNFTALSPASDTFFGTNSDGAFPYGTLILSGNTLYGAADYGGSSGAGTIFAINTDGTGFTNLYNFTNVINGGYPIAGLILSGNTLYGTASGRGCFGNPNTNQDSGGVFSLSLPVAQLTIFLSGTNVILTWPTNVPRFTLQSTTNLVSPAAWSPVSLTPVIVNGQKTVTNPISGAQQFFRLINYNSSETVADPTYSYILGTGGARYFITLADATAGATIYHTSSSAAIVAEPVLPWAGGTAYSGIFERNMLPHSQTIWIQARKRGLTSSNLIKFMLPASS
jgi:uncharacterized repeat protein (TIGR03803 family)